MTLNLSKVFISLYDEEGGQENIAIILKSIFLLQKYGKMIKTVIETHKKEKVKLFSLFVPVK